MIAQKVYLKRMILYLVTHGGIVVMVFWIHDSEISILKNVFSEQDF